MGVERESSPALIIRDTEKRSEASAERVDMLIRNLRAIARSSRSATRVTGVLHRESRETAEWRIGRDLAFHILRLARSIDDLLSIMFSSGNSASEQDASVQQRPMFRGFSVSDGPRQHRWGINNNSIIVIILLVSPVA